MQRAEKPVYQSPYISNSRYLRNIKTVNFVFLSTRKPKYNYNSMHQQPDMPDALTRTLSATRSTGCCQTPSTGC